MTLKAYKFVRGGKFYVVLDFSLFDAEKLVPNGSRIYTITKGVTPSYFHLERQFSV